LLWLRYLDDIPRIEGELYAALVMSTHAHANISVDASKAVQMEGVRAFICVDDVPGQNDTGREGLILSHHSIPLFLSFTI